MAKDYHYPLPNWYKKMVSVILSHYLDLCALGETSFINILKLLNFIVINFQGNSLLKQNFALSSKHNSYTMCYIDLTWYLDLG